MPGVKGLSGGRNAKTREQLERDGTFRKDRHGDLRNPAPPIGRPDPPKELTGEALAEWERMIARCELDGTLSKVDDAALYQYCCLFAETEAIAVTKQELADSARILQENFDRQGDVDFSDLLAAAQEITKLRQLEARYTSQIRQGRMSIKAYLVEFGKTPAARSRVKLPEQPPVEDDFDKRQKASTAPHLSRVK